MSIWRKSFLLMKKYSRQCSNIHQNSLIIENSGPITTIGLNIPKKKNCLSLSTIHQLRNAFKEFDKSDSKLAVLYGEGGNFCSGFDIDEILEKGYEKFENSVECWRKGRLSKKPIIGAINGFAVAEGLELALSCDLLVIEDTAQMGFLGRRFGIPLSMNGGSKLLKLVGQSRAMNLVITGSTINGFTANEWGLAARSVATGTALGQSLNLAYCIAKFPQNTIDYDCLNISDSPKFDNNELKCNIMENIPINLAKFKQGIGKHGKSKNISKHEIPAWDDGKFITDSSKQECL